MIDMISDWRFSDCPTPHPSDVDLSSLTEVDQFLESIVHKTEVIDSFI